MLNQKNVIGALVGGVIGATAALLFAPTSGRNLFKQLSHTFSRDLKKGRAVVKQMESKLSPKKKRVLASHKEKATIISPRRKSKPKKSHKKSCGI